MQRIGIIRAFCLPGGLVKISVPGGQKKLLGCLLGGISTQADTMTWWCLKLVPLVSGKWYEGIINIFLASSVFKVTFKWSLELMN